MNIKKYDINLAALEKLSRINWEENWTFKELLEGLDPVELDKKVFDLNKKISAQIDCTKCANCCKQADVELDPEELPELAATLQIDEMALLDDLIGVNEMGDWQFCKKPCSLLAENKCSIYKARPRACRSFPHLDLEGFVNRLEGVIEAYRICPIVYHVFEELKESLGKVSG